MVEQHDEWSITTNSEIRPAMTHPNSLSESSPVLMVGEVTTPSLEVSDVLVSDSLYSDLYEPELVLTLSVYSSCL